MLMSCVFIYFIYYYGLIDTNNLVQKLRIEKVLTANDYLTSKIKDLFIKIIVGEGGMNELLERSIDMKYLTSF